MAKKRIKKTASAIIMREMTAEERQQLGTYFGVLAGHISKFLLQTSGHEVNYKINGEDISDIKKMEVMDIAKRIDLAVKEERYEDAAKLKKLLTIDNKSENGK